MDASLVNVQQWVDPLKSRGWVQSGGQLTLPPQLSALNATVPSEWTPLLSYESLEPRACEWQVSAKYPPSLSMDGIYPVVDTPYRFRSGAIRPGPFGSPTWWDSLSPPVTCRIELGSGPDARVIYSDLSSGRYSLGIQSRVRIGVARYALAGSAPVHIQSSIAPVRHTDADPPIYSALGRFPALSNASIHAPPGAQWFSISVKGTAGNTAPPSVAAQTRSGHFIINQQTTPPTVYPGPPPWPADDGAMTFYIGSEECWICVTYWVR